MNIPRSVCLEETFFLLLDVLKTNVLTRATPFSHQSADSFRQVLERAFDFADLDLKSANRMGDLEGVKTRGGKTETSAEYRRIWKRLIDQNWLKICAPLESEGLGFPGTIGSAVAEFFLMCNPAIALYYILSKESADIVEHYGSPEIREQFGKRLTSGQWSGTCCCVGEVQLLATPRKSHYTVRGTASGVIGGVHDLADASVQILPGAIRRGNKREHALFMIPSVLESKGKRMDNSVRSIKKHHTLGIKGISIDDFEYGAEGACRAYRIQYDELPEAIIPEHSLRLLHSAALLGSAKLANIFALFHSKSFANSSGAKSGRRSRSWDASNFDTSLKALLSGIRGALYAASFYQDCGRHGGESQKKRFMELYRLYVPILKVYAQKRAVQYYQSGLDLIGMQGYVNEHAFEQNLRDLMAGSFIGGGNAELTQRFMVVFRNKRSPLVRSLIDEFREIDPQAARCEAMRMAIRTWHDYMGGLILLHDDCASDTEENVWLVHSERILMLLGDLIVCYHLIRQGLEAESKMKTMGVDFFNLASEIGKHPDVKALYDKILLAFHFARSQLSLQESHIRIMQEKTAITVE